MTTARGVTLSPVAVAVTEGDTDGDSYSVVLDARQPVAVAVTEGDTAGDSYSVVLDSQPTADVTVTITGVTGDVTLNTTTLTFTSQNWDDAQTVTVTAIDDAIDENTETVTLTHTAASGDGDYEGASGTVTVSITDDDGAGLTLSPVAVSVTEGDTAGDSYSVVLDSQPTADVTVTISGVTGDVTLNTTTLTFTSGNWDDAQTVTVNAVDDAIDENTETVTLTHTAASGDGDYEGRTALLTVSIGDDDGAGLTLSPVSVSVTEGGAASSYTVRLDSQPTADVTVTITGATGDVTLGKSSLVFTSQTWDTAQTVTVAAVDDDLDESTETVTLTHTAASADSDYGGRTASLTVTITDNDDQVEPPQPSVTVSFEKDYHDLGEDAMSAGVGLVLSAAGESEITIPIEVLPQSTADEDDYYGVPDQITFAAGETYTHFWVVPIADAVEEDDEQVWLGFGSLPDDVDEGYLNQTHVTIMDTVHASFDSSSYMATEGGDDAIVTVRLNKSMSRKVTIPLVAEGAHGATSDDWSGVPEEVAFAQRETAKSFTVTAVDDEMDDDGEMLMLRFGTMPGGVMAMSEATVMLMSMEDDPDLENPTEWTPPPCTGTSMTVGSVYTGAIETAGETDWWKVDLDPFKSYIIHTRGLHTNEGTLARPETLQFTRSGDSFMTARRHSTAVGHSHSVLAEFSVTPYTPGIYCFEVGTRDNEPGTYVVEVSVDESAPNGYHSDVAADTSTRGRIHSPVTSYKQRGYLGDHRGSGHDEDWYRVTLDQGVEYQIDVKAHNQYEERHKLTRPSVAGIHDAAGNAIPGTAGTGTGRAVSVDFTPGRTGDYYIAVGSNDGDRDGMFIVCARPKAHANADGCHYGDMPADYQPPRAPRNLSVSQGGTRELTVSYDPPSSRGGRSTSIIGYRVQWKEASNTWEDRLEVTTSARAPGRSYTITGLTDGVEYTVRVLAFNFMGVGEPSEEVSSTPGQAQGADQGADQGAAQGADQGEAQGADQGAAQGADQGEAQGADQGEAQGAAQGADQGADQGEAQGADQGEAQGAAQGADQRAANTPATGGPGISGTPRVGETLTATTDGIADEDGLTGAIFDYRWIRHDFGTGADADIDGGTGAVYTVTSDDAGHGIRVRVSFTDDAGNVETLTSHTVAAAAAALRPAKPTGLVSEVSHDSVTLRWDDPGDDTITGYVILRRDKQVHPEGTFAEITGDTAGAQTTYTDDTAEPGRQYVYRIKAINAAGVSEISSWVRAYTPAAP